MNSAIVEGINKYVKRNDKLFHLGDWSFDGIENIWGFRNRLMVENIYMIPGNHDNKIKNADGTTAHEIFEIVTPYLDLIIDKQNIALCHYPITSWNMLRRGGWMLHGHCHGMLFADESDNRYHQTKIFDVGIDHAFKLFGEYRPFSYTEIKQIMDKRIFIKVDHHD